MATLTYVDGGLDYLQMYSYINYDKKAMLIASDMTGDERLSLNSVCIAQLYKDFERLTAVKLPDSFLAGVGRVVEKVADKTSLFKDKMVRGTVITYDITLQIDLHVNQGI